jgi:MFS family permease
VVSHLEHVPPSTTDDRIPALTNSGGTVSDLFTAKERSLALSLFALAPFLGPVLGPAIAGFITEYSNWRVLFWVNGAFAAVMFCFGSLVPETCEFIPTPSGGPTDDERSRHSRSPSKEGSPPLCDDWRVLHV